MKSLNAAAGIARALILLSTLAAMAVFSHGGLQPDLSRAAGRIDRSEAAGLGAVSSSTHDVSITNCMAEGPAPVNLSDTAGSAMVLACRITNHSDHDDSVVITAPGDLLTSSLPVGCTATASLVVPGRMDFILPAGEQKQVLYRLTFECHAPAVESIVPITIEAAIGHGSQPDDDPTNNAVTLLDSLVIGPAPTPEPTPSNVLDSDGDGYTDWAESRIGTRADKPCGGDGWPSNLVHSGMSFNKLDLEDMSSFVVPIRRLNTSAGDDNFSARWDLVPGSTVGDTINVQDLAAISPNSSSPMAHPPMFGGGQAFGQTCPWPP